jgi:tetratricopeptide (TPR) repeat protein
MRAYQEAEHAGDENGALALAYVLIGQGERDQAEAAALRAAHAGNLEAVGAAACWAYCRTNDPVLEGDLRRGADHFPSARADLAQLLCDSGRTEEARRELTRGVERGESQSCVPLGNLLRDLGDLDAAEDAYRAGIAAGDSHSHHNLGVLLLERGDLAAAKEQFRDGAEAGDALAAQALRDLLGDDG